MRILSLFQRKQKNTQVVLKSNATIHTGQHYEKDGVAERE